MNCTPYDVARLVAAIDAADTTRDGARLRFAVNARDVALVLLVTTAGIDVSTLVRLRREDVSFGQGLVRLQTPARVLRVPAVSPSEVCPMRRLWEYLRDARISEGWLFRSAPRGHRRRLTNEPLTGDAAWKVIHRWYYSTIGSAGMNPD